MYVKGYVQVYTGNGKGKTTASLGLSLRALGAGIKVFFAQFIKDGNSSEFKALRKFGDAFTHRAFGKGRFIMGKKPSEEDCRAAMDGLKMCGEIISSGDFGLVVMDEANSAVSAGLFSVDELLKTLALKHPQTELVITGRNAHPELLEMADLVSEIMEVKHYWKKGVTAREGIEK
ncbi:MAG: cob(I)yrinic acid a,c-diamide adenosyltransferase [Lentisphaerae bacterium GWF2_44_16]|nr:MAG: cob(I)yrinic acid a,c-diamide adenosyltransferase [Lentisphaerae bacterium GWF2_44_16]